MRSFEPRFPLSLLLVIAPMTVRRGRGHRRGSDEVAASKRSYGDLPLIVLTAPAPDSPTPNGPDPEFIARGKIVTDMHDEVARFSSRGVNRAVPGASHRTMISAPQAVIDAVDEVVTDVRRQRPAVLSKKGVR